MRRHNLLISLSLIFLLWFCLAFACKNGSQQTSRSTKTSQKSDSQTSSRNQTRNPKTDNSEDEDSTYSDEEPAADSQETNLNSTEIPGSYWSLISMTKKGEAVKDGSNPPDVEFCKSGDWGILHYGGRREAGTYQVTGNRLVMKYEDGSLYGDYTMTQNGNILTLDDGEYVLRLRVDGKAGC